MYDSRRTLQGLPRIQGMAPGQMPRPTRMNQGTMPGMARIPPGQISAPPESATPGPNAAAAEYYYSPAGPPMIPGMPIYSTGQPIQQPLAMYPPATIVPQYQSQQPGSMTPYKLARPYRRSSVGDVKGKVVKNGTRSRSRSRRASRCGGEIARAAKKDGEISPGMTGRLTPPPFCKRRGPWSAAEDKKLLGLIDLCGGEKNLNWVKISQLLGTRTAKQARERYHQNLKPSLNKSPITADEGRLIEQLVQKYGKRWAEIARHLNGRSDNAIKNWWNGGANRRRRARVANENALRASVVVSTVPAEPATVMPPITPHFNTGIFGSSSPGAAGNTGNSGSSSHGSTSRSGSMSGPGQPLLSPQNTAEVSQQIILPPIRYGRSASVTGGATPEPMSSLRKHTLLGTGASAAAAGALRRHSVASVNTRLGSPLSLSRLSSRNSSITELDLSSRRSSVLAVPPSTTGHSSGSSYRSPLYTPRMSISSTTLSPMTLDGDKQPKSQPVVKRDIFKKDFTFSREAKKDVKDESNEPTEPKESKESKEEAKGVDGDKMSISFLC